MGRGAAVTPALAGWIKNFKENVELKGVRVMDRVKLDGRLGFSLDISREQFDILVGNDRAAARELLVKLVRSDQCHIVGDTYFPVEWNEDVLNYNIEDKLSFDLPEIAVGNPNKIEIDLGYAKLVAEKNSDPNFKEVFVGLDDNNGGVIQDLAVIGGAYHFEDLNVVHDKGVSVKVYSDKDNEDYTHEFSVGIYEPDEEKEITVDELIAKGMKKVVNDSFDVKLQALIAAFKAGQEYFETDTKRYIRLDGKINGANDIWIINVYDKQQEFLYETTVVDSRLAADILNGDVVPVLESNNKEVIHIIHDNSERGSSKNDVSKNDVEFGKE